MKIYLDNNLGVSNVEQEELTQDTIGYNILKVYIPNAVLTPYNSFTCYYGALLQNGRKVGWFAMEARTSSDADYEENYTLYKATLEQCVVSVEGKVYIGCQVLLGNSGNATLIKKNTAVVQFNVRKSVAINNDILVLDPDQTTTDVLESYKQLLENALTTYATKATTYTKQEVDGKLALKADKSTTYTKTEVDVKDLNLAAQMASDKLELNNRINATDGILTATQAEVAKLKSVQNVVEVVPTKSALNSYDTTKLDTNDKVQVIADETHNGASTIYNWSGSAWQYVGAFGGNSYTKAETYNKTQIDSALSDKADKSDTYTKTEVDGKLDLKADKDVTFLNGTSVTISALESGKYLIGSGCTVSDYPSSVISGRETTFVDVSIAPNNLKYIKLFVLNKDVHYIRWFRTSPAIDSGWKIVNNKEITINTFNSLDVYFTDDYVNIIGDIIEGYGVSGETSNIVQTNDYNITDYIKVDNSLKLGIFGYYSGTSFRSLLKYGSTAAARKIVYYDKDKNWISTKNLTFNYYNEDFILLDDNIEYIRFTYAVDTLSNIQVYQYKYINSDMVKPSAKDVDLIMYMGQSNMAGRGVTSTTWTETIPDVEDIEGLEFKAITDPTKLYAIIGNSFGKNENVSGAVDDGNMKTGSMVNSFIKEYHSITNRTIIGVSASQGGTTISQWQPNGAKLNDVMNRLSLAINFLNDNGYTIRNKFVLWCQGESDGDSNTSKDTYKTLFDNMGNYLLSNGIDKIFIVRIGKRNDTSSITYNDIIEAQTELCQNNKNYIMVSTDFVTMKDRGLMKDTFHYYQTGYNEVGRDSARNVAYYVNTHKEPVMYDDYYNDIYITHVVD